MNDDNKRVLSYQNEKISNSGYLEKLVMFTMMLNDNQQRLVRNDLKNGPFNFFLIFSKTIAKCG